MVFLIHRAIGGMYCLTTLGITRKYQTSAGRKMLQTGQYRTRHEWW